MTIRPLAALLVLSIPMGCSPEEDEALAPETVRAVRTVVAEPVEPVRVRSFPAVLEPPQITPLAFDVGGRLGPVDLGVGQEVARGEVLARVEAVDADLRLRQAEAALSEARITAASAREDADRQVALFDRAVVAEAARDAAVADAGRAEARVEQRRRDLDLVRESVADAELRAPFDAVVDGVKAQSFGTVAPGQPVVTLYEAEGLRATVLVSYDVASRLTLGQGALLRPADGERGPLPGTVAEIARRAPAASSFPVVVSLDETRPDLRSGMAVEVLLEMALPEAEHGIPLPLTALATQRPAELDAPGGRAADVFVVSGGRVEPRAVRIGAVAGDELYVVDGLEPGERVVTAGVPFLHPGQEVRLEGEAMAVAEAVR